METAAVQLQVCCCLLLLTTEKARHLISHEKSDRKLTDTQRKQAGRHSRTCQGAQHLINGSETWPGLPKLVKLFRLRRALCFRILLRPVAAFGNVRG